MREILFRGKNVYGDWIEGQYVQVLPVDMPKDHRKAKSVIFPTNAACNWFDKYFYRAKEVIPETIGEFTGLFDKNGKRIFEGDVIKLIFGEEAYTSEVVFHNGGFCVKVFEAFVSLQWTDVYSFEYLGNVHDNPELLQEVQK